MAHILRSLTIIRLGTDTCATQCRLLSISISRFGIIIPYKLSDIGEGIREVTVKEWFVKPGDRVNQFDNICEVQSDKASVTITSRYDGLIKALHYKVDDVALVGNPLVDVEIEESLGTENAGQNDSRLEQQTLSKQHSTASDSEIQSKDKAINDNVLGKVLTTPAVRRIAMENKIQLKDVMASGKNGRILKEDILSYMQGITTGATVQQERKHEKQGREEGTVPSKVYAKQMWKTMTRSLSIPHFVYSDECNVTKLIEFRNEIKDTLKERGILLSYMPFFIKAASKALESVPELNAHLDEDTQTVKILKSHNISVAMDTSEGLVVPNIKNVQDIGIVAVAKKLNRLQELGRGASIPITDISGGTFTLSNIGTIGGTYTKPVILPPQVVIGAIGRTQKLPRFDAAGNLIAAHILAVSWAADHRVIDGVTMAKFSNLWKYYVENPSHLVLDL